MMMYNWPTFIPSRVSRRLIAHTICKINKIHSHSINKTASTVETRSIFLLIREIKP